MVDKTGWYIETCKQCGSKMNGFEKDGMLVYVCEKCGSTYNTW